MTTRDSSLVRRIRRGDAEAFDELVDKYQSPLLGYVAGMCGDPAAAEDVVQDLFLALRDLLQSLPLVSGQIFADGFESGDISAWTNR